MSNVCNVSTVVVLWQWSSVHDHPVHGIYCTVFCFQRLSGCQQRATGTSFGFSTECRAAQMITMQLALCCTLICYYLTLYPVQLDNSHFKKFHQSCWANIHTGGGKVEALNKQAAVSDSTVSFFHLIVWDKTLLAALWKPHIWYIVLCSLFGNRVLWRLVAICCTVFAKFLKNLQNFHLFVWMGTRPKKKESVCNRRKKSNYII